MTLFFKFWCLRLKSHFWWEIITLTCPIRRGVWNLPHKFHLYLIDIVAEGQIDASPWIAEGYYELYGPLSGCIQLAQIRRQNRLHLDVSNWPKWKKSLKIRSYHEAQGAPLILHWIKIEAQDQARGAGSQEIYQWMVRSWSLGNPTRKNNTRSGDQKTKNGYPTRFQYFHIKVRK